MIKFYDFLLTIVMPFVKWWGKLHLPFTHKKVTGEHYYSWRDSIEIGTVLLTKTNGELSNLINPTNLKHAGLYVGKVFPNSDVRYVIEANKYGVVYTDLVTFLTTKDVVVGVLPRFIRTSKAIFNKKLKSVADKYVGLPYDYLFNKDGRAFYCFELAATCLKDIYPELGLKCREILKGKRIYDENTFLDDKYFRIVFDSRKDD